MYTVSLDDALHLVRITVTGFMQADDVRLFNMAMREALTKARQHYGCVRVLADLRAAPPTAQRRNWSLAKPRSVAW